MMLPSAPARTPMFDDQGHLTRPWLLFYEQLRAGTENATPGAPAPVTSVTVTKREVGVTDAKVPVQRLEITYTIPVHWNADLVEVWLERPLDSKPVLTSTDRADPVGLMTEIWVERPTTEPIQCRIWLAASKSTYRVPLDTAVTPASAPFTLDPPGPPDGNGITDAIVGGMYLGGAGAWWGIDWVGWTNPSDDPEWWYTVLTVRKVDADGNAAPDYEGRDDQPGVYIGRRVHEDVLLGAGKAGTSPWGWTVPPIDSAFRFFELRLYVVSRTEQYALCPVAWQGSDHVTLDPLTAVSASAAHEITDAQVGMITYASATVWGIDHVTFTQPAETVDPGYYYTELTVQKVDVDGDAAPDYEGVERPVEQFARFGAAVDFQIANWTIPASDSLYRRFRLRLHVVNRRGDRTLQTTAWSGLPFAEVEPNAQPGSEGATPPALPVSITVTPGPTGVDAVTLTPEQRVDVSVAGPPNWTAEILDLYLERPVGAVPAPVPTVTVKRDTNPQSIQFWVRRPLSGAENCRLWAVASKTGYWRPLDTSADLVSADFTLSAPAAPAATGITDAVLGTIYAMDTDDGTRRFGIDVIQWSNPSDDPEWHHTLLTVQKVDVDGNPAPDYEGVNQDEADGHTPPRYLGRRVEETTRQGANIGGSSLVRYWDLPPRYSAYRYFRFRLYGVSTTDQYQLYDHAWSGADHADLDPNAVIAAGPLSKHFVVKDGNSLELQIGGDALDPAVAGSGLYWNPLTSTFEASQDPSNVLGNGDFERDLAEYTTSGAVRVASTVGYPLSGTKFLEFYGPAHIYSTTGYKAGPQDWFYLEVWVRGAGNADGYCLPAITYWDASYNSTNWQGLYIYPADVGGTSGSGSWHKFSLQVQANLLGGTTWVRFECQSIGQTTGSWLVDRVLLVRTGVPDMTKAYGFEGTEFEVKDGVFQQKGVNLSKAANFSAQFVIDPATNIFKLDALDAALVRTGRLQVGGGGNKVSQVKIFDASGANLLGWDGDDRVSADNPLGSNLVGSWRKNLYIGGASPLTPKAGCDSNGNFFIYDATFALQRTETYGYPVQTYRVTIDTGLQVGMSASFTGMNVARIGGNDRATVINRGLVGFNQSGYKTFSLVSWNGEQTGNDNTTLHWGQLTLFNQYGGATIDLKGQDGSGYIPSLRTLQVQGLDGVSGAQICSASNSTRAPNGSWYSGASGQFISNVPKTYTLQLYGGGTVSLQVINGLVTYIV